MQKTLSLLKDAFVYAGISPEDHGNVRDALQKKTVAALSGATLITFVVLILLLILSLFLGTAEQNRIAYAATLVVVLTLFVLSRTLARKHPAVALPLCYLFITIIFGFAIVLGTINQPDMPATTFCVFLFAVPLLFPDKPYRMSLFLIAITVVFCLISLQMKRVDIAYLDITNTVSFLVLGIGANAYMMRMRMRDLVQQRFIEKERDTDNLTQLMTKAAAQRETQKYIDSTDKRAALLVIDIDDFKTVNDTYGHAYGDAVIRLMGECIRQAFRDSDILGRFGGDEFVLFLPYMEKEETVVQRVDHLAALMNERIEVPESARCIYGSIGIAFYPDSGTTYDELFRHADEALYRSKQLGEGHYSFYMDANIEQEHS